MSVALLTNAACCGAACDSVAPTSLTAGGRTIRAMLRAVETPILAAAALILGLVVWLGK